MSGINTLERFRSASGTYLLYKAELQIYTSTLNYQYTFFGHSSGAGIAKFLQEAGSFTRRRKVCKGIRAALCLAAKRHKKTRTEK